MAKEIVCTMCKKSAPLFVFHRKGAGSKHSNGRPYIACEKCGTKHSNLLVKGGQFQQ